MWHNCEIGHHNLTTCTIRLQTPAGRLFAAGNVLYQYLLCFMHKPRPGMKQVNVCSVRIWHKSLLSPGNFRFTRSNREASSWELRFEASNGKSLEARMSVLCKIERGEVPQLTYFWPTAQDSCPWFRAPGVPVEDMTVVAQRLNRRVGQLSGGGVDVWRALLGEVDYKWPLGYECPVPGRSLVPVTDTFGQTQVRGRH